MMADGHEATANGHKEVVATPTAGAKVRKSLRPQELTFVTKTCAIIGAPVCHGQPLKGVDVGPTELRRAGLHEVLKMLEWQVEDRGDIDMTGVAEAGDGEDDPATPNGHDRGSDVLGSPEGHAISSPSSSGYYDPRMILNPRPVGLACGRLFEEVRRAALKKEFVLTLGGDHSIAAGSIAGMLSVYPDLAVLWIDAHGDCNTPETSPSKHYHGMPAAHVLGWFSKSVRGFEWIEKAPHLGERQLCFIGLRDLDDLERERLLSSDVGTYGMQHVDILGIHKVVEGALQRVDPEGKRPIHLSLDIDACDPSVAPGTGTRARGGLTYREIHYICEYLRASRRLVSMDLVEVNPALDVEDADLHGDDQLPIRKGTTQTVRLGVELVASAVGGKVIL